MSTTPHQEKELICSGVKKDRKHFLRCFDGVSKLRQYWNKWITDDCWMDIINERYEMPSELKFTAVELNAAIARHPKFQGIDTIKDINIHGVYRAVTKMECENTRKRVTAYYVTNPAKLPKTPGGNAKWYNKLVSSAPEPMNTRLPTAKRSVPMGSVPTNVSTPNLKRRRQNNNDIDNDMPRGNLQNVDASLDETPEATPPNPRAEAILNQTFWDTGDAIRYFGARDGEVSARDAVNERIAKLQIGLSTSTGWKRVVDDFDQKDLCSSHEAFNYQLKCRYVSLALRYALDDMPEKTWLDCCKAAVDGINRADGVDHVRSAETVSRWHLTFRRNNESFPNPHVNSAKASLPPLLDRYPELARSIVLYAKQNLNELSAELLYSYLHEVALPALLEERRAELVDEFYTMEQLLGENRLTKLSIPTIFRWMKCLGFKYEVRRKIYYVDGHEKPETKKYRKKMVKEYLANELRMYRWIQLPVTELRELEEKLDITISEGHQYTDAETGVAMVELHVDSHPSFHERMNGTTIFGGNLSVRKPPNTKPLIGFGQDECIFKQYLFTNKAWTTPDGQKPIIPKDEGLGVMLSAFVSREFGFGMKLTVEDLRQVNEYREGKHYSDRLAALEKRGMSDKKPLASSPFVVEFEYGINTEGYWTYDHMVLQMEDCADVLNVLHPEYDYIFLFDHSCGHDRKRPDGLCSNSVRKEYGGKQPKMRDTTIECEDDLGPYRHELTLQVGETQNMTFVASDVGPCWLKAEERESNRADRLTWKKIKISKQPGPTERLGSNRCECQGSKR
jgi:hypothetical protein